MRVGNHVYDWDGGKWDDARWAKYSATWDNGVWDLSYWDFSWVTQFFDVLNQMEKVNIGEYLFPDGMVPPGMDNFKSKARDVIRNLEK